MKKKFLICFPVLMLAFGLHSEIVYSQSESNKSQIDLLLGVTNSLPKYASSIVGLDFNQCMHSLVVTGQFIRINQLMGVRSDVYYNLDVLVGLQKNVQRFDFSLSAGLGLAFRNDEQSLLINSNAPNVKSYYTIGLPIRGKIDYELGKHFALGLIGYTNLNGKQNITGLAIDLGYRF